MITSTELKLNINTISRIFSFRVPNNLESKIESSPYSWYSIAGFDGVFVLIYTFEIQKYKLSVDVGVVNFRVPYHSVTECVVVIFLLK